MTTNSESSSSSIASVPLPLSLSRTPSLRKTSASKLDFLYEVNFISDENKITSEELPLINPYQAFAKPTNSVTHSIRSLIKRPSRNVKEYVQATKFDQHPLPVTEQEQFVTLEIQADFPRQWIAQGFTHIHFGAIRLALMYHGRKGLPVSTRIALLDTQMRKYQHAYIGTIQTTLNTRTILVTLSPNFNMSLHDNRLLDALKIQLQIVGVDQDPNSIGATLHYQSGTAEA